MVYKLLTIQEKRGFPWEEFHFIDIIPKMCANIEWNISGLCSSFLFWTMYCWPEYVSRSHLGQFYAVYYYQSCSQSKFLVSYMTYDSFKVSTN